MNHPVGTTDAIATLTRFSRTLSTATDPAEMLQLLARASIEQLGASGAVVLQVGEEGIARVAAHAGISIPDGFSTNVDEIGPELGRRLVEAAGEHFEQAHTFPLVSDGDLFGALVVLFKEGTLAEVNLHLAAGLVDLAAAMLGKAHQCIGLNRAHADLKLAQEILARTEKLRALGEMAAGISHDLGNILNPMSLQIDRLEQAPQDIERVKKVAESLRRVLKRGVDTVERLRAFSRQSPEENAVDLADVNALLTEAIDLVRHRTGFKGTTVEIELGGPPQVMLPSSDLVTALVNIIVNAFEALPPQGGSVAFRTGVSAHGAWVQVQDTGSGIPDEVRRRLFEPFFTTKGMKGTGLGLSMVYAFVQRHAGQIDVQSAPGQGTTITLTFPSAVE